MSKRNKNFMDKYMKVINARILVVHKMFFTIFMMHLKDFSKFYLGLVAVGICDTN